MTRRNGDWLASVVLAAVFASSCIELSVDPKAIASIEFVAPANPSIVIGDSLADSLGGTAHLRARVFTADGDEVTDAPIYFVSTDTLIRVVSGDIVVANPDTLGTSKLYAVSGSLQSASRSLTIVRRPDSLAFNGQGPDTIAVRVPSAGTAIDTSKSVAVTVRSGTNAVATVRVKFELLRGGTPLAPDDTVTYALVTTGARLSTVDTTDASGIASRVVRVRAVSGTPVVADTLEVQASVSVGGTLLNKPVRRTVLIIPAS